jgi:hypothetical protein
MTSYKELHSMEMKYADGGPVKVAGALQGVNAALHHLDRGDHAAAAAALEQSPAAMQHPQVRAVHRMLRGNMAAQGQQTPPGFASGGSTSQNQPTDIVAHLAQTMQNHPETQPVLQAHAIALLRANLAAAQAIHSATGDPSGFGHFASSASTLAGALGSGSSGQNDAATQALIAQTLQGSGSMPQAVGPAAMQAARQAVPAQQQIPLAQRQAPIPTPNLMGPQAQT